MGQRWHDVASSQSGPLNRLVALIKKPGHSHAVGSEPKHPDAVPHLALTQGEQ